MSGCKGNCGQGRAACDCWRIAPEPPPGERMGCVKPWERFLLHRGADLALGVSIAACLCFAALLWLGKP